MLDAVPVSLRLFAQAVLVKRPLERPLGRENDPHKRNALQHRKHAAIGADDGNLPAEEQEQKYHGDRQQNQSCAEPNPPGAAVRKIPCVLIFHGHRCPVSKRCVDVFRRIVKKHPSKTDHGGGDQQIHEEHKNPKSNHRHRPFRFIHISFSADLGISGIPFVDFTVKPD